MNNNYLAGALVGLLFLSALSASLFCFRYLTCMRKLSHLQGQFATIQNRRNQIQALANDAVEYSRRNPAIDPLLQDVSIKPRPANPGLLPQIQFNVPTQGTSPKKSGK